MNQPQLPAYGRHAEMDGSPAICLHVETIQAEKVLGEFIFNILSDCSFFSANFIDNINKIARASLSEANRSGKKLSLLCSEALKKKNPKIFWDIEDFKNRKSFWKNLTMGYCRLVSGNRGIGNFDRN